MSEEIEAIERAALEDLNAAASETCGAELGMHSGTVGSAYASVFGALPASAIVVNRVIGLGLSEKERPQTIDAIVDRYAGAGVARYFVHLHPDARPAEIGDWLTRRGLVEARAWMKFRRGREAPPAIESTLEVRPARAEDAEAFGRIEADAFDLGSLGAPWLAQMIGRPNWHVYLSFDRDTPAGAGVLYVKDEVAWLDWGATAPAFRGRGRQSVLLRRRILDALDLGCRLLATATGEEVPGDAQISYANILKLGFEPAYLRKNFAPPKSGKSPAARR